MSEVISSPSEIVREAFKFTVDRFPLAGPDAMRTPWFGLFRSDTCEVVGNGSVSKVYVPHTTDDVCALVDAAAETFGGDIKCQTHFKDGHYVNIVPSDSERLEVFDTDTVYPRLIIRAGYDGRAFSATMGYYRDVCRNLSIMHQVKGLTVSIRHTSGLRSKMDDLINAFQGLKSSWGTLTTVINRLSTQEVRMSDFLNKIYSPPSAEQLALAATGQKVRGVTVHADRTRKIWERLNRERNALGLPAMTDTVTAWEAYNAIQGYVQHDASGKTGFNSEFSRILRASRDAAVLKAERILLAA
jgi:hypothetical protein